jgi:hypothetical protein
MLANARPCPPVPPLNLHGKEGVDGSSPSEGSTKALQRERFLFRENLHDLQRAVGMEPSGSERALKASEMDAFAGKIVGCAEPT